MFMAVHLLETRWIEPRPSEKVDMTLSERMGSPA